MSLKKKEKLAKEKGLELSPKYGVNPTILKCFWCGEDKGISLMGRIRTKKSDDVEAPKHMVMDYDICENCKKTIGENIMVIEVTDEPNDTTNVPIANKEEKDIYPTGRWVVMKAKNKEEARKRMFINKTDMDELLNMTEEANS